MQGLLVGRWSSFLILLGIGLVSPFAGQSGLQVGSVPVLLEQNPAYKGLPHVLTVGCQHRRGAVLHGVGIRGSQTVCTGLCYVLGVAASQPGVVVVVVAAVVFSSPPGGEPCQVGLTLVWAPHALADLCTLSPV